MAKNTRILKASFSTTILVTFLILICISLTSTAYPSKGNQGAVNTIPGKISYELTADGALSEPAATTIPTPTPTAAPTPTPKPTLKPAPTPTPAVAQTPKSTAVFNPNTYTQSEMFPAGAIAAATMVVTLAATVMVKKRFEANDSLEDTDLESI
jgi:hypothetical protein